MMDAEMTYDRMEREWLASRAVGACEDCAMFVGVEAGDEEIDSVLRTIGALCCKRPDVERTWAAVSTQIGDEIRLAIESHGYCAEYGTMVCGAKEAAECDGWVPLEGVAR